MANIAEAAPNSSQLNAALRAGIEQIDRSYRISFTKYVRLVLPLDGYVFWVRADLVSQSALLNAAVLNSVAFDTPATVVTAASVIKVQGSLHYASETVMEEAEAFTRNSVIFTAESDIDEFNEIGPSVMYIGEFDGIRFTFSQRRPLYIQAGIYHYVGDAIYPAMEPQIIDDVAAFDITNVVVSNSLPIWLTLNQFMPVFPSFIAPQNTLPPYATVHVLPETTEAIQSTPFFDATGSQTQLVKERVRVTIYGMRNFNTLDYINYVLQFAAYSDSLGVMNMPVPRDEKRTQTELTAIAMKKVVEFEVNYYQSRARTVAQKFISSALATVLTKGV